MIDCNDCDGWMAYTETSKQSSIVCCLLYFTDGIFNPFMLIQYYTFIKKGIAHV